MLTYKTLSSPLNIKVSYALHVVFKVQQFELVLTQYVKFQILHFSCLCKISNQISLKTSSDFLLNTTSHLSLMYLLQFMSFQTAYLIFKMKAHALVFWLPHQNTVIQERMKKKHLMLLHFPFHLPIFLDSNYTLKLHLTFPD